MTDVGHFSEGKRKLRAFSNGQIALGLLSLFCLLLILRNPTVAIEHVSIGLRLCARSIIPSLFPFMVLSEMIVAGGLGQSIPAPFTRPLGRLLRLSPDGCCALLLGMLCGFPIGARAALRALEEGRIPKEEAERLIGFSSTPSSAFLVSVVGASLWGNAQFGTALYLCTLASALLTGVFLARLHDSNAESASTVPFVPTSRADVNQFPNAIRSATQSILLVCAYVVFFSALVATLDFIPGMQSLPATGRTLLLCILELSTGMSHAVTLANPTTAALLCAFAAGWSGISVHCQTLSLCDKQGVSLRPYLRAKLLQSLLAPLLLAVLLALFPQLLLRGI